MSEEPFEPPIDPTKAPALAGASEAGLYSPEAHSFSTPEQAEVWLSVAARELSGHGAVPGVDARYYKMPFSTDEHEAIQFSINMRDEMAEQWKVEGKLKNDHEEGKWLSTSIACTTHKTGVGPYTSAVYRDSGRIDIGAPIDGHAYSISKYEDNSLDGEYNPQLTRTQPGELTDEESAAAEKRYIEMVNQFKQLLELKVASTDIDKIIEINRLVHEEHKAKAVGLMQKLHFAKTA